MRRIFSFFHRREQRSPELWTLSPDLRRQLLALLSEIGLRIVDEARAPVPLLKFGRRVLERLESTSTREVPLPHFADALKRVIREMEHERLRVMSPTDFLGVGYVYNATDPETWPIRSGR